MRDKVTRQSPQATTFEEKGEAEADSNRGPSASQPNALPLGQPGSPMLRVMIMWDLLPSDVGLTYKELRAPSVVVDLLLYSAILSLMRLHVILHD